MNELETLNNLLNSHTCVHAMHFNMEADSLKLNLTLKLGKDENKGDITILFTDISRLKMDVNAGGLVQLVALNVRELNDGHDRIKYALSENEDNALSFNFYSFKITA